MIEARLGCNTLPFSSLRLGRAERWFCFFASSHAPVARQDGEVVELVRPVFTAELEERLRGLDRRRARYFVVLAARRHALEQADADLVVEDIHLLVDGQQVVGGLVEERL